MFIVVSSTDEFLAEIDEANLSDSVFSCNYLAIDEIDVRRKPVLFNTKKEAQDFCNRHREACIEATFREFPELLKYYESEDDFRADIALRKDLLPAKPAKVVREEIWRLTVSEDSIE